VWVNLHTKLYYQDRQQDDGLYENGKLRRGRFMTEADAKKAGFRAAKPVGKNVTTGAAADVKLLKTKATDVKYHIGAARIAQEWVDAVEANGTPAEKALAHKWLDVHVGARAAGAACEGCETSRSEKYFAIEKFYEEQGREFKAYAKRWEKLGNFAMEQETGEHIPTTAEVLAGVADNVTGQVGQMRQNQAQAAEELRQMKQQQADAQSRSQVQAQQQAAEQRLAQQQAALQRSQQQAASQRQQQEQYAAAAQAPVANYQPQCYRAEVSHERQCTSGSNITLRVVSVCPAPMNARFCVQRADGTWQCGQVDGVSTGPIASTNALQYVCDGTGQTKVWMRATLQGGWVPWPEP